MTIEDLFPGLKVDRWRAAISVTEQYITIPTTHRVYKVVIDVVGTGMAFKLDPGMAFKLDPGLLKFCTAYEVNSNGAVSFTLEGAGNDVEAFIEELYANQTNT